MGERIRNSSSDTRHGAGGRVTMCDGAAATEHGKAQKKSPAVRPAYLCTHGELVFEIDIAVHLGGHRFGYDF